MVFGAPMAASRSESVSNDPRNRTPCDTKNSTRFVLSFANVRLVHVVHRRDPRVFLHRSRQGISGIHRQRGPKRRSLTLHPPVRTVV